MSSHDCIKWNNIFFLLFFFPLHLFFISAKSTQLLPSAGIQNAVHRYGTALYISSFPGLSGEGPVPRGIYIEAVAWANMWWDRCLGIIPWLWSLPLGAAVTSASTLKVVEVKPVGEIINWGGKLAGRRRNLENNICDATRRSQKGWSLGWGVSWSAPSAPGWAGGGFHLFSEHHAYQSICIVKALPALDSTCQRLRCWPFQVFERHSVVFVNWILSDVLFSASQR